MTEADLDRLGESVKDLTAECVALRGDLRVVGTRQKTQTRVSWAAIVVGALLVTALIIGMIDNRRGIVANNKLWCPVLSIVGSNDPPRETDAGRTMVTEIYRLGHRPAYGCW